MAVETAITTAKKKTPASRSWILLDCAGDATVLDADKYEIMHRVQIHARDLRILDPLLSYPSTILGREGAIVLNLEHIKAIITADEVLLRDPYEDHVIPIVEELRRRLPLSNGGKHEQHDIEVAEEDESPFEFRALEVALEAICSFLDARTTELETAAYPALDELTSKISSRNLDRVRKLKSAMTRLTARVQKVRDELEQLLDDDDDMADLYLSRKLAGASSPVSGSGVPNWSPTSPTIGSKISRASRARAVGHSLPDLTPEQRHSMSEISRGEGARIKYFENHRSKKRRKHSSSNGNPARARAAAEVFLQKAGRELLGFNDSEVKGPLQNEVSDEE